MLLPLFLKLVHSKKKVESNSAYVSAYHRLNQGKASLVILHVVFSYGDEAGSPLRLQHPQNNLICYDEKTKVISSSFVRSFAITGFEVKTWLIDDSCWIISDKVVLGMWSWLGGFFMIRDHIGLGRSGNENNIWVLHIT